MKKLDICTTIALYDLEAATVDFKGLFTFLENWLLNQGYTPLRGSADGEGITATKTWTFKHTKRTLEKREFQNLTGFWFAAYPPQWGYDMTDGLISAHLSARPGKRGILDFYFHHDVLPFDPKIVEDLIKDISQYVTSRYGIVYQRDFDKGPGLYAVGIITGLDDRIPEEEAEEERIGKWFRDYSVNKEPYHLGLLRDIYPMNLLSEAHLTQSVLGTTLKAWIESSPDHGELKKLTDILWEWWIPESEISAVREALKPTGLLLCA